MPKEMTVSDIVQPRAARRYDGPQLNLIRRTVAADCTPDEFDLFVEVARNTGLDPFRRQIYAVVYNKNAKDQSKRKMSIITGIDGFRAVAARNGNYRPDEDEYHITVDESLKHPDTNPLGIEKCTVKVWKMGPDREWYPITGTAYWHEFAPLKQEWAWDSKTNKKRPTDKWELSGQWPKMPKLMIAKCAEAQALRRGWPEDLSGIYAPEEMEAVAIESTATAEIEHYREEERLKAVNARDAAPIQWKIGEEIEFVPYGQFVDRCLAHIREEDIPKRLEWWMQTNSASFRMFWASHKHDALAIKAAYEERLATILEASQPSEAEEDQRPESERTPGDSGPDYDTRNATVVGA